MLSINMLGSAFFGGAGDQRGTAIAIEDADIYLSGNLQPEAQNAADMGVILNYSAPFASGAAPTWSRSFDYGTSFFGIAATNEGVYPVGYNYSLSSDPVGGKEVKSIAAKFNTDGTAGPGLAGSIWYQTPNIFGYSGVEIFRSAGTMDVGGSTYLYAAGAGQPFSYAASTIAKYDTAGNLQAVATDPNASGAGFSEARGLSFLGGNVYTAGYSTFGETSYDKAVPTIWQYNANLGFVQQVKDTSLVGAFNSITEFGGDLYAAGYSNTYGVPNSENYLVQKYDFAGNRLWSTNFGGAGVDALTGIVAFNGQLYAVGYTSSSGAGGRDAVVLEIDSASGTVLSTNYFGGALDDQFNGVATDGSELYAMGESRSTAQGGNAVGQNDVLLVRYAIANAPPEAMDDSASTAEDVAVTIEVLDNDDDPDDDPLQVTAVSDPEHGSASINGDGTVTYNPDPDFHGSDSFTYSISDGNGGFDTANVTVTVLSASQQIDGMLAQIQALVSDGSLNQGQGNSLSVKLGHILAKANAGQTHVALNQLNAFTNQVTSLMASGVLTPEEGQPLLDAANNLRTSLSTTSSMAALSLALADDGLLDDILPAGGLLKPGKSKK